MAQTCCPTCGRSIRAPRARALDTVNTEALTDAQVFEHFKTTAPIKDVEFFLAHADMSAAVREAAEALLTVKLPRAEHYRRLAAIKALWRQDRDAADIEAGRPAVGSERWNEENNAREAAEHAAVRYAAIVEAAEAFCGLGTIDSAEAMESAIGDYLEREAAHA